MNIGTGEEWSRASVDIETQTISVMTPLWLTATQLKDTKGCLEHILWHKEQGHKVPDDFIEEVRMHLAEDEKHVK